MKTRPPIPVAAAFLLLFSACGSPEAMGEAGGDGADTTMAAAPHIEASSPVEAGAYLVQIAGCNDCHTAGWLEEAGKVPREGWLKGWPVGFRGPWGTTYASNLRLTAQGMTEDEWVRMLGGEQMKPPMPWFNLHRMSEPDRRAIYRFIESLGPAGDSVPASLPPGQEPKTPYIPFTPREPASE